MLIEGIAVIDGKMMACKGKISMHVGANRVLCASWQMFDMENRLIAMSSRNFFLGEMDLPETLLAEVVIRDILKYRIARKKVFAGIRIAG
jgi:hypothetical protein